MRGKPLKGGRINNPMAYASPNPVRPDYDGPIAIYGLAPRCRHQNHGRYWQPRVRSRLWAGKPSGTDATTSVEGHLRACT
ncbi:MAG: hypothetical protein IPK76_19285 [Lewinellaceae bacterium]|nr:hypothetical protein [Lewinellaceae bacterium]